MDEPKNFPEAHDDTKLQASVAAALSTAFTYPSGLTLGLRGEWRLTGLGPTAFFEARNLTDEVYSPTVSVDDGAARYFQPADGRSVYAGVRWHP